MTSEAPMTDDPTTTLLESIRQEQQQQLARLNAAMREAEGLPRVQIIEVRRQLIITLSKTQRVLGVRDGRG